MHPDLSEDDVHLIKHGVNLRTRNRGVFILLDNYARVDLHLVHRGVAHRELRGAARTVADVDLHDDALVLRAGCREHGLAPRGVGKRAGAGDDPPVYLVLGEVVRQHVDLEPRRPAYYRAARVDDLPSGPLGGYRLGYPLDEREPAFVREGPLAAAEHGLDALLLVAPGMIAGLEEIRARALARRNGERVRRVDGMCLAPVLPERPQRQQYGRPNLDRAAHARRADC